MLDSARKSTTMHKLPLFSLFNASEDCTSLKEHSLNTVQHHRPRKNITGHGRMVIDQILSSRPSIIGRSALYAVDWPYLSAESCFDSSKGQTWHGNAFSSKCMHHHTPYHAYDSKEFGTRPSGHQSRISMHDGPRSQVVHFHVK